MMGRRDNEFADLRGTQLRKAIAKDTLKYMSYGEFKAYVACKVLGVACPRLYNVQTPDEAMVPRSTEDRHGKAQLMLHTLQTNDIVVGGHARDHLLRAFGLPTHKEQPISAPRLRTLLVRHYVEAYPIMAPLFGLCGFTVHDDEHCACEEEKFHTVRGVISKRPRLE